MRIPGFYWIKHEDSWLVAEWDVPSHNGVPLYEGAGTWWLAGSESSYGDDSFVEIDERRIEHV